MLPVEGANGVKMMSVGWLSGLSDHNVRDGGEVRDSHPGLLALKLLHTTKWGDLDYLLVDTPPGTGDVPHALAARAPLHGSVVVTTPSALAVADVVRGVRLLERLRVPIVALVENMATFSCDGCGAVHAPFGEGHADEVRARLGLSVPAFRLPIVAGGAAFSAESSTLDALADAIDAATADAAPVALPHELAFHELPHWPTEMATAAATLSPTAGALGAV